MTVDPLGAASFGGGASTAMDATASTAAAGSTFGSALGRTRASGPNNLFARALATATSVSGGPSSGGTTASASGSDLISLLLSARAAGGGTAPTTAPAATGPSGADAVAEADKFLGTAYVWGGSSPGGFDCSGLVQYVYAQLGVNLPRTSQEQATVGTAVPGLAAAQPGDLLFFAGSDGTASAPGHVGIYVGNGQMLDAPYTGTNVQIEAVPADQVVDIRRVLPAPGAAAPTASATTPSVGPGGTVTMGNVSVPSAYAGTIEQAASANGIPPALLAALVQHESGFDPNAVSPAGAEGIAQFMPSTAAGMGVNPYDPTSAIDGAAQLLGSYTSQFGSYADALAAYNAGPSAVQRYGGIPPYAETQAYVPAILASAGLS